MCGTAAEVSAVNSVDDRPIPCPGPMTTAIADGVRQGRARPGRPVQGLGRAVSSDAGDAGELPGRRSRSSTRRCATARSSRASRSPSRTSCGRRAARLARRAPGSRAATRRPTRRTRSSSGARRTELTLETADAGGLRLHPPPGRQGRRRPHAARRSSTPAPRRCASSARAGTSTSPRPCGTTLDEGVAMVGETVAFLKARRPAGVLRRRALLRRLQGQPRVRPARARGGRHQRRRLRRAVRHQRRLAAPRGAAHHRRGRTPTSAPTSSSASTPRTTPAARWPTRSPPCSAGPPSVQGTVNGYGERTGNANLMTCIPNLS